MRNELVMRLFSRRRVSASVAEAQITALSQFRDGLMRPDKCGAFEPTRTRFDPSNISEPIRWLSAPAGRLIYRKGRPLKMSGTMWNLSHPELWERDRGGKAIRRLVPQFPPPLFINYWTSDFDARWASTVGLRTFVDFVLQMFDTAGADFGLLTSLHDLDPKNYATTEHGPVRSMSYKGLDPSNGVPGLYWTNLFSARLASWLGLEGLPDRLATVRSVPGIGVLLQFGEHPDGCRSPDVLERQREVIERLGAEKFFDIRFPDRKLDAAPWDEWPIPGEGYANPML